MQVTVYGATYEEARRDAERKISDAQHTQAGMALGAGAVGAGLAGVFGVFWLLYQGVKRPLAFAIYALCLFAALAGLHAYFGDGTIMTIGMIVLAIAFLLHARSALLAIESFETWLIFAAFRQSLALGRVLHVALYVLAAICSFAVAPQICDLVIQIGNGLGVFGDTRMALLHGAAWWIAGALGAVIAWIVRAAYHPTAGYLTPFGGLKTHTGENGSD